MTRGTKILVLVTLAKNFTLTRMNFQLSHVWVCVGVCVCVRVCLASCLAHSLCISVSENWKIEVGFCGHYLCLVSFQAMSLGYLIHFSFSEKTFLWGFGSKHWVSAIILAPAPDAILRKGYNCFLMWDTDFICVKKDAIQCRGHGSLQVLSSMKKQLFSYHGGRQNLKSPGKPQMPNWKETAGHDHSGHCPLPSGIRWKWEDTVDGQTVSGPGLSTYHEQARKWVIYATDRHPTEIHLPFLTLENPANLWLTQTKQAIIEHIQRKPSEFWLGKMA